MRRGQYDPLTALQNAGRLMGMQLEQNGMYGMCGPYYLNGERHPYRKDKLKVFISRGNVFVYEEGGRGISLQQWLVEFGGAADWKEAVRMIKGESQSIVWDRGMRHALEKRTLYVEKAALEGAKRYPLENCPLFRWMCGMFPEEKVREAWDKYNVTTDSHNNCVYWYVDANGNILYDKRIAYGEDGHRIKTFFPSRQYRVGDGYNGKCYFGAHAIDPSRKVYVAESEKAVLMIYLMYGRQSVATGGKSNLRELDKNMVLLPDYDNAKEEWEVKAWNAGIEVWPWWEHWGISEIPEHSDIADMIEWKIKNKGK